MRIGVIGYGAVGARLVRHIESTDALELAFVFTRTPGAVDHPLAVSDLAHPLVRTADLVVEAAHPEVIARVGEQLLADSDLMVVSAGGLVDDARRAELVEAARRSGHRIIVPFGALSGLESLAGRSTAWRSATITFVKPPHAYDPPAEASARTVIYDGPVRGVAELYPRNVNAMVTFALATVGLDATRGILVSDPDQSFASLEYEAHGDDGGTLRVSKSQPLIGVSGSEMPDAIVRSLTAYTGGQPGLWFG